MQQVNLVDARLLPPPQLLSGMRLAALAVLALVALGTHIGSENQRLSQTLAQAGADPEQAGDAAQAPNASNETALQASIHQRRALRDLLVKADDRPQDSAAMLRQVFAALPSSVWLTEVDLRGRMGLRIAGGTLEPAALRGLAERLERIEALHGVAVETVRIEPNEIDRTTTPLPPPSHRFVLASAAYLAAGAQQ